MGVWRGTGSADVVVGEGEYAGLLGRAGDDILVDGGLVSAVPGYGPGNVLDAVAASGDRLATLDWVFFEGYLIVSPDPGGSRLEGGPGADILVSTGGADTLEGDGGLDITLPGPPRRGRGLRAGGGRRRRAARRGRPARARLRVPALPRRRGR